MFSDHSSSIYGPVKLWFSLLCLSHLLGDSQEEAIRIALEQKQVEDARIAEEKRLNETSLAENVRVIGAEVWNGVEDLEGEEKEEDMGVNGKEKGREKGVNLVDFEDDAGVIHFDDDDIFDQIVATPSPSRKRASDSVDLELERSPKAARLESDTLLPSSSSSLDSTAPTPTPAPAPAAPATQWLEIADLSIHPLLNERIDKVVSGWKKHARANCWYPLSSGNVEYLEADEIRCLFCISKKKLVKVSCWEGQKGADRDVACERLDGVFAKRWPTVARRNGMTVVLPVRATLAASRSYEWAIK